MNTWAWCTCLFSNPAIKSVPMQQNVQAYAYPFSGKWSHSQANVPPDHSPVLHSSTPQLKDISFRLRKFWQSIERSSSLCSISIPDFSQVRTWGRPVYPYITSSHPWSVWKPAHPCGAAWPRQRASMAHWAAPCGSVLMDPKFTLIQVLPAIKTLQAAFPRLADLKDITCMSPSIAIFWSFNPSIPFRDGFGSLSPWQASFGTEKSTRDVQRAWKVAMVEIMATKELLVFINSTTLKRLKSDPLISQTNH